MKELLLFLLRAGLPVLFSIGIFAQSSSNVAQKLSPEQYRDQIARLLQQVGPPGPDPEQAQKLADSLPDHFSVQLSSQECSIDNTWLKKQLSGFEKATPDARQKSAEQMRTRLQMIEAQAQAFLQPSPAPVGAHAQLNAILGRREFRSIHGPTAMDRLRERVIAWIDKLLTRIFPPSHSNPRLSRWLEYLFIAVAAIVLVVWTRRRFALSTYTPTDREIMPFAPSARSWRSWLQEACANAQEGDWRNGIHFAYWAGVSFLEQKGAWKPDRARTPREYLKLIEGRGVEFPVLYALTRKFEVTWYGNREASAADFEQALAELEKLGCR